jgi:hypothetical protein
LCRILSIDYDPPTRYVFHAQQERHIIRLGEKPFMLTSVHGHHEGQLGGHRTIELAVFTPEGMLAVV